MGGKSAQGTTISRETSLGSGVFVVIANVKGYDGPSMENPEIDVTHFLSTAKQFIGGLIDYGELSCEVLFDPEDTTHQQAIADMEASPPTVTGWRLTFANPTKNYTWPAFVKSFPLNGAVDAPHGGTIKLRLAGARVVS